MNTTDVVQEVKGVIPCSKSRWSNPPAACRSILGKGTDPVEQIATFAWQPLQSVYARANVTSCVV